MTNPRPNISTSQTECQICHKEMVGRVNAVRYHADCYIAQYEAAEEVRAATYLKKGLLIE